MFVLEIFLEGFGDVVVVYVFGNFKDFLDVVIVFRGVGDMNNDMNYFVY